MIYSRYLSAAARAMCDDVLPTLESEDARIQMINCLRIVSRVAMLLEDGRGDGDAMASSPNLPDELRAAFARHGEITEVSENVVLGTDTVPGVTAAAEWLADGAWLDDPTRRAAAKQLLAWEAGLSRELHQRLIDAEVPVAAGKTQAGEAGTIAAGLLRYLRAKLGNSQLKMREFRMLPGGRARMTALFLLEGHEPWPDWLVIHRDPMGRPSDYPGVVTQEKLMRYMNGAGLLVPHPLLLELDGSHIGAPFMIVERMPGSPPNTLNFFAPPPPSEKFALSLAEQLGKLHALSPEPLRHALPNTMGDRKGWANDLEWLIGRWNEFNHGPSLALSGIFAWMRRHVGQLPPRPDVFVHGDMMQHNMLVEDQAVTAILDWESGRIGHPGEDLGYMRPMVEKLVPMERFMEVYRTNGGLPLTPLEVDYFTFRSYIWANTTMQNARNMFENGTTDDIRLAEIGVSLTPQFLDCITTVFERLISRGD